MPAVSSAVVPAALDLTAVAVALPVLGAVVILTGTVLLLRAGDDPWDLAWRLAVIGVGHGCSPDPARRCSWSGRHRS